MIYKHYTEVYHDCIKIIPRRMYECKCWYWPVIHVIVYNFITVVPECVVSIEISTFWRPFYCIAFNPQFVLDLIEIIYHPYASRFLVYIYISYRQGIIKKFEVFMINCSEWTAEKLWSHYGNRCSRYYLSLEIFLRSKKSINTDNEWRTLYRYSIFIV